MSKTSRNICIAWLMVVGFPSGLLAQGTQADFQRADRLRQLTRNKVFRSTVRVNPVPGADAFWYDVETGPNEHQFVFIDAVAGKRQMAFDHDQLGRALAQQTGQVVKPDNLPFRTIELVDPNQPIRFSAFGKHWSFDPADGSLKERLDEKPVNVKSLKQIRPSGERGRESEMRFVNRLDEPVRTFWIDETGRWVEYGRIQPGGRRAQHSFANHVWLITDDSRQPIAVYVVPSQPLEIEIDRKNEITPTRNQSRRRPQTGGNRNTSPDGKWKVSIVDSNVVLRNVESGEGTKLSEGGSSENPFTRRFYWSPDSSKVVVIQEKPAQSHEVQIVESSPKDRVQPKLVGMNYLKPGDDIAVARPQLFDVIEKKRIPVDDQLFQNPWRISDIRWRPDSSEFFFLYNQRGHQSVRIFGVDAVRGDVRVVVDETSQTFVDYANKLYSNYSDDLTEMVWMSERDGWNHLYLIDLVKGQVKRQLTTGQWVVRGVERVDWDAGKVWIRLSGYYAEQDPYYVHHAVVDMEDGQMVLLTEGDGHHEVEFLAGGKWLLDRYSRVDMPPVHELRNAENGKLNCQLEQADWEPLLETGWQIPERFQAKGRDGETDIFGVIYRPTNFDPGNKYPVIEDIYAGPHDSFVPKRFGLVRRGQALAELGFIVVQIDGMGTSNRSKAFHDVCHKNLGDSGFPDRIAWIQTAARKYPYMDLQQVGIFGGSAGGQSSLRALLAHGDFYHVAVSDCGCHDNRMDKIWWNELWMGWPIGPHYHEQSNVTQAHRLQGKLLLTVGELDRNVDPASTMQVVNALIKADKDFDFIIVPGAGHGVGESRYLKRRRRDFFVRNLLGVEPRRVEDEKAKSLLDD